MELSNLKFQLPRKGAIFVGARACQFFRRFPADGFRFRGPGKHLLPVIADDGGFFAMKWNFPVMSLGVENYYGEWDWTARDQAD